jgi:uncharacterized protein
MTSIPVQRHGSYLEVDEQGHIQSRADAAHIKGEWQLAVEALVAAYLDRWGENIHSIYVCGSLAKGFAVDGVSDIDSFAVLQPGEVQTISYDEFGTWAQKVEQDIREAFPFVAGVELDLEAFASTRERENPYTFILKTEAACSYGESLVESIRPYKLSPEIAFQTRFFEHHLDQFISEYPSEPEEDKPDYIVWLMRRFLRLGMELVMVDERRYTHDLYLCYESFAKYYPDQAAQMYRALELAVNPKAVPATESFVRRFGNWLTDEAQRKLTGWGYVKSNEGHWERVDPFSKGDEAAF